MPASIKVDSGLTGPITVRNNLITQTAPNPPAGFWLAGIGVFGGYSGSQYTRNTVQSNSAKPFGWAFLLWNNKYLDASSLTKTFTDKKRGLHDIIADTLVIKTR